MNKMLLCIALVFCAVTPVDGYYLPPSVPEMLWVARKIVVGEIVELEDQVYVFRVQETLRGTDESEITVARMRDWACAVRTQAYEVGQRQLLFLTQSRKWQGVWGALGAGYEGEVLLDGEWVCLFPNPERPCHFSVGSFAISVWPAAKTTDLIDAVRDFDRHFEVELDKPMKRGSPPDIVQLCGDRELIDYASRSTVHRLVVENCMFYMGPDAEQRSN